MKKIIIAIVLQLCVLNTHAENWSENDIARIQTFSLKSLQAFKDPSNKYLDNKVTIKLGKSLFEDTRLSSNGKVSCSSCHIEKHAFTDNKVVARGLRDSFRNTLTLLNVGAHHWFFADGAKDSLWSQALSSIENPAEQNFTRVEAIRLIATDQVYRSQFKQVFNQELPTIAELSNFPIKAGPNAKLQDLIAWKKMSKQQRQQTNSLFSKIGKSIAAYVTTLKSKPTAFDFFIEELIQNKPTTRLNDSQQRGLRLFLSKKTGCTNCHSGPLFSNKSFHNIATGIPGKDNGRSEVIESVIRDVFNCLGPYSDAKPEQCVELNYINRDKHQLRGTYKTPTLRGIKDSAPYMHDGRFKNLNEVLDHYLSASQDKTKKVDLTPIKLNQKQKKILRIFY